MEVVYFDAQSDFTWPGYGNMVSHMMRSCTYVSERMEELPYSDISWQVTRSEIRFKTFCVQECCIWSHSVVHFFVLRERYDNQKLKYWGRNGSELFQVKSPEQENKARNAFCSHTLQSNQIVRHFLGVLPKHFPASRQAENSFPPAEHWHKGGFLWSGDQKVSSYSTSKREFRHISMSVFLFH